MKKIIQAQKNELTEYYIYRNLAKKINNKTNAEILLKIADEEKKHEKIWSKYTNILAKPYRFKIWRYTQISLIFGLTFGIKLMENGEKQAQINYDEIAKYIPEAKKIEADEHDHEKELIGMIDEKILQYMGSVVLGLNDALVELTGVLAGLTLGLQDGNLIAVVGLITGISAAFSMAGSKYLSVKAEDGKHPVRSAIYTGIAYISTVFFLILPYFLISNVFVALGTTLGIAILIILIFNFYLSVAKDLNFKQRFLEMTAISIGVALLSFGIGFAVRNIFGIEM
ncbi:MAG: rubrerythrin family protein [candidate division SR1 bacterium]|nr:MAG: rubrerythrin family protein [candidate division SR1 bacterium]